MDKYMFESPGSEVKQHGSDVQLSERLTHLGN